MKTMLEGDTTLLFLAYVIMRSAWLLFESDVMAFLSFLYNVSKSELGAHLLLHVIQYTHFMFPTMLPNIRTCLIHISLTRVALHTQINGKITGIKSPPAGLEVFQCFPILSKEKILLGLICSCFGDHRIEIVIHVLMLYITPCGHY